MADYWKSQTRKYCDFCKCWIADNKPSIEFHEKGRRHQENIKKRIKNISKQTRKDERETVKVDQALRHMESAALQSYRHDVENNADFSSMAINKKLQDGTIKSKKVWHEAKASEGYMYYYNIITNETLTVPPREGYLSIDDQRELSFIKTKHQLKAIEKHNKLQVKIRAEEEKREEEEDRARAEREKLKAFRVEDLPEVVHAPIIPPGKTDAYGQWQTVRMTPVIDYQLPQQESEVLVNITVEPEPTPAPREFKEKKIESLGEGSTSFKRRKIGARNTRSRLDDE